MLDNTDSTLTDLDERIEARISQAENRMIRYLLGIGAGFLISGLIGVGWMSATLSSQGERLTLLERNGATPMQVAVARTQEQLSINAIMIKELKESVTRIEKELLNRDGRK